MCQLSPPNHPSEQAIGIQYFETIEDAEDIINEIDPIEYQKILNPQTIFASVVPLSDEELLHIQSFMIEAVVCD